MFYGAVFCRQVANREGEGWAIHAESSDIESAITGLSHRLKRDREELCGLEVHHQTQDNKRIDQLGITIQQLGRARYFP